MTIGAIREFEFLRENACFKRFEILERFENLSFLRKVLAFERFKKNGRFERFESYEFFVMKCLFYRFERFEKLSFLV